MSYHPEGEPTDKQRRIAADHKIFSKENFQKQSAILVAVR